MHKRALDCAVQGACGLEASSVQTVLTMDQVVQQQEAGVGDNKTSFKAALNTLFKDFKVGCLPIRLGCWKADKG